MHGLNEGHVAPYTDIEIQLTKYHTYIKIKTMVVTDIEETVILLTIKRVKQIKSNFGIDTKSEINQTYFCYRNRSL